MNRSERFQQGILLISHAKSLPGSTDFNIKVTQKWTSCAAPTAQKLASTKKLSTKDEPFDAKFLFPLCEDSQNGFTVKNECVFFEKDSFPTTPALSSSSDAETLRLKLHHVVETKLLHRPPDQWMGQWEKLKTGRMKW